jgi:glycosyltransferase involved in cell wall biosynthesis
MKTMARRMKSAVEMRLEAVRPVWLERFEVQQRRRRARPTISTAGTRRLFVDVSVIATSDAGTGIQRVVRGILRHVTELAGDGWSVILVRAAGRQPYEQVKAATETSSQMIARPGDVFLGLDYSLDAVVAHQRQLARFKRDGGTLWFLVHDLLPLQRPEWFSRQTVLRYRRWLRTLAVLADGFFCNSAQTESELRLVLAERYGLSEGFRTQVLPMGADLVSGTQQWLAMPGGTMEQLLESTYVLMVGTLEPRKGHDEVLSAFERLWPQEDTKLVIVGRPGWKTEALQARLRTHPMLGTKLFWFNDLDDQALEILYSRCLGVIVAAKAEGYGLPVLEALSRGRPVLARDLPIFRQHEDRGVCYFPERPTIGELAEAIRGWVAAIESGSVEVRSSTSTWRDTTISLLAALDAASSEVAQSS